MSEITRPVSPKARPAHGMPTHTWQHSRKTSFAAVAAVLTLLLVVPIVLGSRDGGAPTASAREVLTQLAQVSAAQPALSLGQGQYLDHKSITMHRVQQGSYTLLVTTSRETWVASNGTGLQEEHAVDVSFESPADKAAWEQSGERLIWGNFSNLGLNGQPSVCNYTTPGQLSTENLDSLPSDPDALEQALRAEIIHGDIAASSQAKQTSTMFEEIGYKLANYPGPPQQRSALFQVLARQPGIEALGSRTDHLGRSGTDIGSTWYGVRSEMIVDPATGQVLEFRAYQVDPPSSLGSGMDGTPSPGVGLNTDGVDDPGTLLRWSTMVRMDVVNSLPPFTPTCG